MPSQYYICDSEDLFESCNILGELISVPKVGDKYVYKDRRTKKKVYTDETVEEILPGTGDSADMYLKLSNKTLVRVISM